MPRKILIVIAIVITGVACNLTARALTVQQPSSKPVTTNQHNFNPQQPRWACWQNCTLVPQPPNVMGY